jgi:O-succinylbenzoate synthase
MSNVMYLFNYFDEEEVTQYKKKLAELKEDELREKRNKTTYGESFAAGLSGAHAKLAGKVNQDQNPYQTTYGQNFCNGETDLAKLKLAKQN